MGNNIRNIVLVTVASLTFIVSIVLMAFEYSPDIAIVCGVIALIMVYAMWSPPNQHKEFSNSDRIEAMTRAMGGSPPAEFKPPNMPQIKHPGLRKNK
jgi:hypothetical protein